MKFPLVWNVRMSLSQRGKAISIFSNSFHTSAAVCCTSVRQLLQKCCKDGPCSLEQRSLSPSLKTTVYLLIILFTVQISRTLRTSKLWRPLLQKLGKCTEISNHPPSQVQLVHIIIICTPDNTYTLIFLTLLLYLL